MGQPPAPKTYWRCGECASEILFKISDTQVECVTYHKLWSIQELFAAPNRAHAASEALLTDRPTD